MYVALHIPDFPVTAALRANPQARNLPSAILAVKTPGASQEKLPILSLNDAARFAGIEVGWPLSRALVRCPNLNVLTRDPNAEAALWDELVGLGESLAPDVEVTAVDTVVVDLSTRRNSVAEALEDATLRHAEIWHARAETPDLAHLGACYESTCGRIISPAELVPLPLSVLAFLASKDDPMALLELWGLKTLGDFMKLPRQAMIERLGPEPGKWHDILNGKNCRLLKLHRPPESLAQNFDFDDAVFSLDQVVFALKRLLHTLAGRLAARHLAASSLLFRLHLEAGENLERRVRLPEPQTAVEGMFSPLQTLLESLQLDSAVVSLDLDAETTFATAAQREWFGKQLPQPERWSETLAKLEAMLGPGRVGIPIVSNSFKPDSFTLHPAAGSRVQIPAIASYPECPVPLHRYRPARNISVAFETRDNQPWPLALLNGPHPGEIIDRRGPFILSGDWWDPADSWQRLEWDVQVTSSHLLRLVFEPPDHWKLEGVY